MTQFWPKTAKEASMAAQLGVIICGRNVAGMNLEHISVGIGKCIVTEKRSSHPFQ